MATSGWLHALKEDISVVAAFEPLFSGDIKAVMKNQRNKGITGIHKMGRFVYIRTSTVWPRPSLIIFHFALCFVHEHSFQYI